MRSKPPSYRQRPGYTQALVTLTDAVTKQRRDYWLGEHGSPQSRELYHQVLAEWEANGRRLPDPPGSTEGPAAGITVAEVMLRYWRSVQGMYSGSEVNNIGQGIKITRQLFGSTPAEAFGPKRLRMVRDAMVRGEQMHANRTTPLSCGNRPGTNRCEEPQRGPRDHYTRDTYHTAIQRACDAAFPPPLELARQRVPAQGRKTNATRWETSAEWKKRLGERWADLKAWQRDHRWHPHQLRHSAGTRIRRDFGLEAAQIALGHSSALVTDAVYAERDMAKAIEVMKRIG